MSTTGVVVRIVRTPASDHSMVIGWPMNGCLMLIYGVHSKSLTRPGPLSGIRRNVWLFVLTSYVLVCVIT